MAKPARISAGALADDPLAAYLFYDTFTDVTNTPLSAHVAEKGGGWATGFEAREHKVGAGGFAIPTAAGFPADNFTADDVAADGTFVLTLRTKFVANNATRGGLFFNVVDQNNWWYWGTFFNLAQLYKRVAGVDQAATYTSGGIVWANGGTRTFKVVTAGDVIKAYLDDVLMYDPVGGGGGYNEPGRAHKTGRKLGIWSAPTSGEYHWHDKLTAQL